MNKLIETLRNIFRIEELKDRIVLTFALLLVYRLGSYVVLPGVDPVILERLNPTGGSAGLTGLIVSLRVVHFLVPPFLRWVSCRISRPPS